MTGRFKSRLAELIERADECYDPEYVVDVLALSTQEILEAFSERFYEERDKFPAIFGPLDEDV